MKIQNSISIIVIIVKAKKFFQLYFFNGKSWETLAGETLVFSEGIDSMALRHVPATPWPPLHFFFFLNGAR